ncbi:MAG: hypothetical protein C0598_08670 [Marinilabiliales bacterium]|nr:MAG: hypothetical protein C0598_08670 [Marinilabiliales bacterium]
MKTNKLKHIEEPEPEQLDKKPKKKVLDKGIGKAAKDVLAGEYLSERSFRFFPFLLFLALLASIYIANNYLAENKIRKVNDLREELKELRYEYITGKSDLMEASKQSNISDRLKVLGIKENTQPVKSIIIKKEE